MNFRTIALAPFSALWWGASTIRNFLFDRGIMRPAEFSTPVVGLGNLSMGGTGKTPMTLAIAGHLAQRGKRVAILSRGYGRRVHGFQEVMAEGDARTYGDEPLMMKRRLGDRVRVFVCEDRVMGMVRLMHQAHDTDVVVCDDVYQHRRLKPGLMILLTTYGQPFCEDYIFPSGSLREARKGVRRADQVVLTKCPEQPDPRSLSLEGRIGGMTNAPVHRSWFSYSYLSATSGEAAELPSNLLLVTGLANAEPLKEHLEQGRELVHLDYADHHRFPPTEVLKIQEQFDTFAHSSKGIVTTEKDWVKIAPLVDLDRVKDWYLVTVRAELEDDSLMRVIDAYVDRED